MTLLTCEIFLKNDINEFFYKTETDSQTETDLWFAKREGWIWSLGLADADCYVQNGLNDKI